MCMYVCTCACTCSYSVAIRTYVHSTQRNSYVYTHITQMRVLCTSHCGCRSSVMCLPSHFHLLRTCTYLVNNGDLEDIDALLGCPVVMCTADQLRPEAFQGLGEPVRSSICLALFLCLNWYLESVCAFAGVDDTDMQWKVMKRLKNVIEVETQLETCIACECVRRR